MKLLLIPSKVPEEHLHFFVSVLFKITLVSLTALVIIRLVCKVLFFGFQDRLAIVCVYQCDEAPFTGAASSTKRIYFFIISFFLKKKNSTDSD